MKIRRILGNLASLVLLGLVGSPLATATDPVTAPNPDAVKLLAGLNQAKDFLASKATPRDGMVIREVTFHVSANVLRDHLAFAKDTPMGREVHVALSLLYELGLAAEIQYVERAFGVRDLMNQYIAHCHQSYQYEGRKLVPIEDFARLDEPSRTRLRSPEVRRQIAVWIDQALLFVVAHELGHHTRDAFYFPNDADAAKQQKEQLADEWGAEAMLAAGFLSLPAMMLLTELLEHQERMLPAEFVGSHQSTPDRALYVLSKYRAQQRALYQTPRYATTPLAVYLQQEQEWENELKTMRRRRAARTRARLDQMSATGDVETSEALALDYLYGGSVPQDVTKAKVYLERAASGGGFWAQSTLGFVYANGTAGPRDDARSRLWLGLAALAGEKVAKVNLDLVARTADPAAWCQGKCVLDATTAVLQPCEARARAACLDSCEHGFGHTRAACENYYCTKLSDEQRYFDRCFQEPDAERWQACASACTAQPAPASAPANLALESMSAGEGQHLLSDDFGRGLTQVAAAAPESFLPVRARPRQRNPGDDFTEYGVSQALSGLSSCNINVYDDPDVRASFQCGLYRGTDSNQATLDYRALVARVNSALVVQRAAPCSESVRRSATRAIGEVTVCRGRFSNGAQVRVERTVWNYTGRSQFTTKLWVDAPSRAVTIDLP